MLVLHLEERTTFDKTCIVYYPPGNPRLERLAKTLVRLLELTVDGTKSAEAKERDEDTHR